MPILGIIASGISGHLTPAYDPSAYDSLASVTLSASSSSVVFAAIPPGYKYLQIRGLAKTDRAANAQDILKVQYNQDTTASYSSHNLEGNGSIATYDAYTSTASPWAGLIAGATASSGVFAGVVIDILDYANSNKAKTLRSISGLDNNDTNGRIYVSSTLWTKTAVISSIVLAPVYGSNFVSGTTFALYGVK